MKQTSPWEKFYSETPLDKIPWQNARADYLVDVIKSGKVKPGLALDLGCGTGINSVFLAENGFEVTGVDISKKAIDYAKANAKKAQVKIDFFAADATDLSFLNNKKFDFILDWANLHGIPKEKRDEYINGIVEYSKTGSKFLLRCFSNKDTDKKFVKRPVGIIYLFSRQDIEKFFGKYFKILETNESKSPTGFGKHPSEWFDEYLLERL